MYANERQEILLVLQLSLVLIYEKPAQDYLDKALYVYKTLHDVISYLQNRIKEN